MNARILVLNSFVKGWNILKSLAGDGFEVNAADYRSAAPGLFSNRISDRSKNLIYPNPKVDEEKFVESVLEHISKHKFDIILPVNAAEMMALAKHRNRILEYALFPFENYYKLLLLHDKKYFFEVMSGCFDETTLPRSWSIGNQTPPIRQILSKAKLSDIPVTPMPDYANADIFLSTHPGLIYPLIVKTRRSTSAEGVFRVGNDKELRRACQKLNGEDIIIQENLIGRGVGISSIRWVSPDILEHFGHKRVREYPISGGASTSRESWDTDNHPLANGLADLLIKLDWHGVVMFELKESMGFDRQFEYKFLEANPRFWGSVPLAIANGVNFPVLLCRAALGMDIPIVKNLKRIRARIFFSDTLSLLLNICKGRRVGNNLKDYINFTNLYLDDIDWGDIPATRKIFRQMAVEFFDRVIKRK